MAANRIVFGLVAPSGRDMPPPVARLTEVVGDNIGATVSHFEAPSYETLADAVREDRVDVAWLPPIVFVRLAHAVTAIGSILRGGKSAYEAALVVKAESSFSSIDGLRGARAGWVDPWSAAGFVLPRVKLALLGVDPRSIFRTETFYGSHRALVHALMEGACDVAGTYARADADGAVTTGAWSEIGNADVRVLATFGAIPPDVIAARSSLPEETRSKVLEALRTACADDSMRPVLLEIFGGTELSEGLTSRYDALRSALDMASARGLFD